MKTYEIPAENTNLELTLTCGQTFCWHRTQGELYGEGKNKFYTFQEQEPIIAQQKSNKIIIETPHKKQKAKEALGLNHDLEKIFSTFPTDQKLEKAKEELWGLRIVQDEFFPCLISYLCSPQMRIPRIKKMHNEISREFGETQKINNIEMLRFPTQEELSKASENQLRELGIGYRAKYISETMKILEEDFKHTELDKMGYEEAQKHIKNLYGVGDKVADCVLLFSKEFHQAYPLDTWAMQAVEKHYPEQHSEDYQETSKKLRNHFGKYSGYAQEYIFHAARKGIIEV